MSNLGEQVQQQPDYASAVHEALPPDPPTVPLHDTIAPEQEAVPFSFSTIVEDLDSEKILVTTILFVVAFLVLSPVSFQSTARRWKRLLRRRASKELLKQQSLATDPSTILESLPHQPTVRRATSYSSEPELLLNSKSAPNSPKWGPKFVSDCFQPKPATQEEPEEDQPLTEEETFLQLYKAIQTAPYRRLVLPPTCVRVENFKPTSKTIKKEETSQKKETVVLEDDHPLRRLQLYANQISSFLQSILEYDYITTFWWVLHWISACVKSRQLVRQEAEMDDDEDQESTATHASQQAPPAHQQNGAHTMTNLDISPLKSPNPTLNGGGDEQALSSPDGTQQIPIPISPLQSPDFGTPRGKGLLNRNEVDLSSSPHSRTEEKKDEPLLPEGQHHRERDSSMYSYDSLPIDFGESDYNSSNGNKEETKELAPPGLPSLPRKRKDALENYPGSAGFTLKMSPMHSFGADLPPGGAATDESAHTPLTTSAPATPRERNQSEVSSDGVMRFFDAAHSRESLKKMTVDVPVPDRNGYILGDEFLPDKRHTPLLVFVNSRSGPQQGQLLITQLRRLLNPIQVWDLADGGPEKILESFCVMTRLRILVCGGDGTVSWIISALEKMDIDPQYWPPMAILPLGTGNDLARLHGWGGGYTNESLITILEQVAESYISLLDRWEMQVEDKKGKPRPKETKSFFNYLGVGVDAQAALQVHMLRESTPKLFFSRAVNKAWYAIFGAEDFIKPTHANLHHDITLIADGVEVPLPADSQGIILLNIDSYAGGIPMWSHGTKAGGSSPYDFLGSETVTGRNNMDRPRLHRRTLSLDSLHQSKTAFFDRTDSIEDLAGMESVLSDQEKLERVTSCDLPSSCQDGLLDIVSIRGTFHLGQIRVGLSNAQKLCQCSEATIIIKKKTAVQVDGEPWRQPSCKLHIKRKKDQAIMLHRSPDESGGVETEMAKLLDWAEERDVIDRATHNALMKEWSRRIENKTRLRRANNQDNLMLTLKRTIGPLARTTSFQNTSSFPSGIAF